MQRYINTFLAMACMLIYRSMYDIRNICEFRIISFINTCFGTSGYERYYSMSNGKI